MANMLTRNLLNDSQQQYNNDYSARNVVYC